MASTVAVGLGQVDFDELALAHLVDTGKPEPVERLGNGLALGVEDAILEGNVNASFHCINFGPLRSRGPLSGRMPRRRATSW